MNIIQLPLYNTIQNFTLPFPWHFSDFLQIQILFCVCCVSLCTAQLNTEHRLENYNYLVGWSATNVKDQANVMSAVLTLALLILPHIVAPQVKSKFTRFRVEIIFPRRNPTRNVCSVLNVSRLQANTRGFSMSKLETPRRRPGGLTNTWRS